MEKSRDQIKKGKAVLKKEKTDARKEARVLLEKKGATKSCEYCGINEKAFSDVWGPFYGGKRGKRLEPDHKDNDYKNNDIENLCWACSLCNCAKSNKLTHQEMIKVGAVIKKIWQKKAVSSCSRKS